MNFEKYHENTKNALPHNNLKELMTFDIKNRNAIDLGCGTGRDTIFLIKNNWNVTSIDRENTESFITKNLSKSELENFKFIQNDFENLELERNNLIVANNSIPFCHKKHFNAFWKKVTSSIEKNRILCWKLFWRKRFLEKHKKTNGIFK